MFDKIISGFTANTVQNLVLDAGALYKNFDVASDTVDTATAKLIGATRGGVKFNAKPEIRQIAVDGVKGAAKGMEVIDSWDTSISAAVLEVSQATLALGLTASQVDSTTSADYHIIKAKNHIQTTDYIDNITYIGTLSGQDKPVIVQVYNVINVEGVAIETKDKDEVVLQLTFKGHYDTTQLEHPPFAIYYPKGA